MNRPGICYMKMAFYSQALRLAEKIGLEMNRLISFIRSAHRDRNRAHIPVNARVQRITLVFSF